MFAIPAPTPYDVKFPLLGVPVRIHPLFWVMTAALGWQTHDRFDVFIWIACVFASILVHEFGHALTAERLYRTRPSVTFHLMGGLCAYDHDDRHPWREAAVLAMGPGAGFLLFGVVAAVGLSVLGFLYAWPIGEITVHRPPLWLFQMPEWAIRSVMVAYDDLLFINLAWGLFNLLPIYPLDGGQLAGLLLKGLDRREGPSRTHVVGILTAGGLAVYFASRENWINAFFLANLAFMNYQLLQMAQARRASSHAFEDDDDNWWRK